MSIISKVKYKLFPAKQKDEWKKIQKFLKEKNQENIKAKPVKAAGDPPIKPQPIAIADFHTFFGLPGSVLTLSSHVGYDDKEIYYGYTYNGTQKGYYKYTIQPDESTGNGQGSDSYTHHTMIIEVPIDDKSSYFYVPAVIDFVAKGSGYYPITFIFWAIGRKDIPPKFESPVGMTTTGDYLLPGYMDKGGTYHSEIGIYNEGVAGVPQKSTSQSEQ